MVLLVVKPSVMESFSEMPGQFGRKRISSVAQVIDIASYRRRLDMRDHDSVVNALWNELTRLAHEAWTWRDPEIVQALEFHLAILKAHVHADWQK